LFAHEQGVRIQPGAWFTHDSDGLIRSCCAIGALLIHKGTDKHDVGSPNPGYVRAACEILKVDAMWLNRFWMGFDRNHHVTLVKKEKDSEVEIKDDVSGFGIELRREVFGR